MRAGSSSHVGRSDRVQTDAHVTSGRARRVGASLFVLFGLVGTWLGHTLEYLRTDGPGGLMREMSGSVHLYMLPVGAGLLVLAAVGGVAWFRAVSALAARLDRLRRVVRRGGRVDVASFGKRASIPGRGASAGSLWLLLGLFQLCVYLLQENVEARLAGLRAPGFGAVLGQHWAAAPIHLLVAGLLAVAGAVLLTRRRRLSQAIGRHELILARLWARRVTPAAVSSSTPPALTPHQRWGSQRWQRPPPASIAA